MAGFQSPITIYNAIQRIKAHEMLLPSFQREFVWNSYQIENLFDSLMRGYPISSMLFWKVKGDGKTKYKFYNFLTRFIQNHHTFDSPYPTQTLNDFHAVLDGQQRLTALFIGLCGSYAYHRTRYSWKYSEESFPKRILYLNISTELPEDENEKKYEFLFREVKETRGKILWIDKDGQKWFKVGEILQLCNPKSEYDLDDFTEEHQLSKDEKKRLKRLEKVVFNELLINYYEEDDSNPERAVNIFVRVNSGGTPLSLSDILFSIVVANWEKDAKELISQLVNDVNAMDFKIIQDFVLRAFLMLYGREVKFKIKNFTSEFVGLFEEKWDEIKTAIIELFKLLRSFGLNDFSLTSYNATLPILFYLYHTGKYKDFSTSVRYKEEREEIRKWLMKALLLQTFGGSSDTTLQRVRGVMIDSTVKGEIVYNRALSYFPSIDIERVSNQSTTLSDEDIDRLLESTQKGWKYSFAVLSLLFPNLNYADRKFHQDHLHPISAFNNDSERWSIANSIINLQMLQGNENESKNALPLKDWIEAEIALGRTRDNVLADALIPYDAPLEFEKFDEFVTKRKTFLRKTLRKNMNIE